MTDSLHIDRPSEDQLSSIPLLARRDQLPAEDPNRPAAGRPGRVRSTFTLVPTERPRVPMHLVPNQLPADLTAGYASAAAGPASRRPTEEPLDWGLVAAFRQESSKLLMEQVGGAGLRYLPEGHKREQGRAIILDLLRTHAAGLVTRGEPSWSAPMLHRMSQAVFDAQFRLGRLQPLVDDDSVENIIITGHDQVILEDSQGRLTLGEPVAESDQELLDFLVFLASRSEANARPFSESIPALHMRLDGGARLAATAWVTPRPSVVIRRHRLRQVTLRDLVGLGSITPVMASFLAACVRARKSIVVSGSQGAGKTTLVRALCGEIDPWEAIGTFETEYELGLDELTEQHRIVHAWEARPGSGEIGPTGRRAGEFTLAEAIVDSFRFNLSRQIVGEVRGAEVWPMIKVMESGAGSLCTTHAANARMAMDKLVTCAMESGPAISAELARLKLAQTVDVVVHQHAEVVRDADGGPGSGRRVRYVSEILAVQPGEEARGYALTQVFAATEGRPGHACVLPEQLRDLDRFGFDAAAFYTEANRHTQRRGL